jgi:hypothetical protein
LKPNVRPSLRWDSVDYRRNTLRAFDPPDPATAPILTVRGANRLAVEALPWRPTFLREGGDVATLSFLRRGRELSSPGRGGSSRSTARGGSAATTATSRPVWRAGDEPRLAAVVFPGPP